MTGARQEIGEWLVAVDLIQRWENGRAHLDTLLDSGSPGRSRWLVMAVFRDWLPVDALLGMALKRTPRPVAKAILRLALAECLQRAEPERPPVVHHAGEVAAAAGLSRPEKGFINAVLRRLLREGRLERVSLEETHPGWLVERWRGAFGNGSARHLLEWNQSVPDLYVSSGAAPDGTEPTRWAGVYRIRHGRFDAVRPELEAGRAYIQDPFARIPVGLLDPRPGEIILDLCAAPGGKSFLIGQGMEGRGRLVLVDRPGPRRERLLANVARFGYGNTEVISARVEELEEAGAAHGLSPGTADAVLIDVPCSNTGVIRRRPDVKLRLEAADIHRHATLQLNLLREAARWVRRGGRLVYSTCSLEAEENDGVVEAFLNTQANWRLNRRKVSLPWECGHDGGGAFLLTRHDDGQD